MNKTVISIDGSIIQEYETPISEERYEEFVDRFLELVEEFGWGFGGGIGHHTSEEFDKILE